MYLKRFRLLPPELFWFRIAAQATPQKIGFVFKAKFLRCFSLAVLSVLSALKRLELSPRLNKIWFLHHRHSDFLSAKALEKSYVDTVSPVN